MGTPVTFVNAFTEHPFAGNPAGVCLLNGPADPDWMHRVAIELNQPVTAFVFPEGDDFNLRWFTPTTELVLCGHGTLAAAHALWDRHIVTRAEIVLQTVAGVLRAERRADGIGLDFPSDAPIPVLDPPSALLEGLGAPVVFVGRNRLDYLVELESAAAVRGLQPDVARLAEVETRGVIVTAASDAPGIDFVSRFFSPSAGIAEDAVTGSAHCCLGPYWGARLGKDDVRGYQASARGGFVRVQLRGDRVGLLGQAVTVLRGELAVSHSGS